MEKQSKRPLPQGARRPFVLGGNNAPWQKAGIAVMGIVVVGIGVLSLVLPKPETSLMEKRELAKRPAFTPA